MDSMAIGCDNTTNLIWLIGGVSPYGRSLISFNLSTWNDSKAFLDHGYPLPVSVYSASQAYVQMGSVVYVAKYPVTKLSVYNMLTKNINTIDTNPSYVEIANGACLASIADSIIYTYTNKTYILTVSNQSWKLSGNPIVPKRRYHHACIIEPDEGYLYVIGGVTSGPGYSDSISKLHVKDIVNIHQYNFTTLTDKLTYGRAHTAAVLYGTDIYVAGGHYRADNDVIDT